MADNTLGINTVARLFDDFVESEAPLLDAWGEQVQSLLGTVLTRGGETALRTKDFLNGVWVGHPLHPALVSVPIGAWTAGVLLDLTGNEEAADAVLGVGILASLPTAASGVADWADTADKPRRLGVIHALLNTGALGLLSGSWLARRTGQRGLGVSLSTLGWGIVLASGWIGGEMSYRLGTNVNRNAFATPVRDFHVAARLADVKDNQITPAEITVDGQKVSLVLLKQGPSVLALSGVCSHWGGPLGEGTLQDGACVQCPWHGSVFRFQDGGVEHGPATAAVPVFETRLRDGNVEVRQSA